MKEKSTGSIFGSLLWAVGKRRSSTDTKWEDEPNRLGLPRSAVAPQWEGSTCRGCRKLSLYEFLAESFLGNRGPAATRETHDDHDSFCVYDRDRLKILEAAHEERPFDPAIKEAYEAEKEERAKNARRMEERLERDRIMTQKEMRLRMEMDFYYRKAEIEREKRNLKSPTHSSMTK